MLQQDGRVAIQQAIEILTNGGKLDGLLEENKDSRVVYLALHDMAFLERNGYAHLVKSIYEQKGSHHLIGELETVLLQSIKSKRWGKYGYDDKNYDLVLAVPKWSRIISLSTTEIEPKDLVKKLNQFDTLILENYHFYEFFNKLHGVSGRNVKLKTFTNQERADNLGRLNFLFRSCNDAQTISKCKNMKMFTLVPDINGKVRVGFFFAIVGKIRGVRDVLRKDGTGIDPQNFIVQVSDGMGDLDVKMATSRFTSLIRTKYLSSEINHHFGHVIPVENFTHPFELMRREVSMLMVCNWFLGDDSPNFSFGTILNKDFEPGFYHEVAYGNTRKKVSYQKIMEKCGNKFDTTPINQNLKKDSNEKWVYYKEDYWDEDIFQIMLKNKFEIPSFHEQLQSDIPVWKFKEWQNYTNTYFQINDYAKTLYVSEHPELDFATIYSKIQPNSLSVNTKFIPIINTGGKPIMHDWYLCDTFIPDLESVNKWSDILVLSSNLKNSKYQIPEIFGWTNGGRALMTKWINLRLRKAETSDEIISALSYIFQARGHVMVPIDLIHE